MTVTRPPSITRTVSARIPTSDGEFQLYHYANQRDFKEHLALVMGEIADGDDVLVRVHSECFTGDVLGSRRCDCGEQLQTAMRMVAAAGRGIIIYLRQEGRGIGLEQKLRAYNLQDQGYDTVEANLLLGHQADERDYWAAAAILTDLQVKSVRLITNNPTKIEHLSALGVCVNDRLPVATTIHNDNRAYLTTKVQRMRHILDVPASQLSEPVATGALAADSKGQIVALRRRLAEWGPGRAHVTVSYAQSLDGSIAAPSGKPTLLSSDAAMAVTHALRASHDALLVGIGTILADDPRLTVRLVDGASPQPVIVDSQLRTPVTARIFEHPRQVIIATTVADSPAAAALRERGAAILTLPATEHRQVDLSALLSALFDARLQSVMVEGGAAMLTAFLSQRLADYVVVTVAPRFVGGVQAINRNGDSGNGQPSHQLPQLQQVQTTLADRDLIIWGEPVWANQTRT